jgi:cell division septal protein FtsQ
MEREQQDIFPVPPKARPGLSKAKLIIFGVIFVVVAVLIFASTSWTQSLEIKEISIIGNKYFPKQKIVDKVYSQVLSHKLSSVNFEYVKSLILSYKFIQDVEFITTYPEKLIISVKPKHLLAIGKMGNGKNYYLTDEGEMLEQADIKLGYSLPVVDYGRIGNLKSKENLKEIALFLKNYYYEVENSAKALSIWRDKFGICFSIENAIVVRVGNLEGIADKFHKFEIYLKEELAKTNFIPDYIDLRWSNQVVTN